MMGWIRLCSTRLGSWKADQSPGGRCNFYLSNLKMLQPLKEDTRMRRRLGVVDNGLKEGRRECVCMVCKVPRHVLGI